MRILLIIITILATIAGIYFLSIGIIKFVYTPESKLEDWSNLGQFVSGFTVAFFTLATILLITLAYINQREEIDHLKDMNTQQDKMIKAQVNKDEYEKFERTYYRLLDWYNSFRNSISYVEVHLTGSRLFAGRGALNKVIDEVRNDLATNLKSGKDLNTSIDTCFDLMFKRHDDMQPYFNNLYSVLDFVNAYFLAEIIEEDEASKFMFVLNGQLARAETELLFYYGLYSNAPNNLKQIIQNYGLLKNIKKNSFSEEEIKMYENSAYT